MLDGVMKVLGIETSCDETAIAIVSGEGERLSVDQSFVFSQIDTHEAFGGVVPEVAARLHLEKLLPMLATHVSNDGSGIDAVAVTAGPGLAPALRTGVETAKTLAWLWNKPLVPVSHLEGHIYANWLQDAVPTLPALCLIVSGGHTELIVMRAHGEFERIGETLDDAAGEAFDKVAQMLGLGYPGGPKVEALAKEGDKKAFDFPRGLLERDDFDFSFSGIKTSVLYTLRRFSPLAKGGLKGGQGSVEKREVTTPNPSLKRRGIDADVAASFQEAVVDALITKTKRAAESVLPASLLLAGGVAANSELRNRFEALGASLGIPVFVPPFKYSLDNAAMIAAAGCFRAQDAKNFADPLTLEANSNLDF